MPTAFWELGKQAPLCNSRDSANGWQLHRFEGGVTEVDVGSDPSKTFFVHDKVLRGTSTFLDAAMKETWREGRTRQISLPEEDPDAFYRYIHYTYFDELPRPEVGVPFEADFLELAKSYTLGERMMDERYQNRINDRFLELVYSFQCDQVAKPRFPPTFDAINEIYSGTAPASPLRRLLADLFAAYIDKSTDLTTSGTDAPAHADFVLDLVRAMAPDVSSPAIGKRLEHQTSSSASSASTTSTRAASRATWLRSRIE